MDSIFRRLGGNCYRSFDSQRILIRSVFPTKREEPVDTLCTARCKRHPRPLRQYVQLFIREFKHG